MIPVSTASAGPRQGWDRPDVLVAGAGPAGMAAAAACARAGLRVTVVAPSFGAWRPTYCLWHDEAQQAAAALGLGAAEDICSAFDRALVRTGRGQLALARRYAVLDNTATRGALQDVASAHGATFVPDRVVDTRGDGAVRLASGRRVLAALTLDATGPGRAAGLPAQRAWGEVVRGAAPLVGEGEALFMDWATPKQTAADFPWFLYALDRGDGTALVEATSLAAGPPVSLPALRGVLQQVLERHGLEPVGLPAERVSIPLGAPPRQRSGGAVPLGAAAGLVHPATGYSVAASLLLAPRLAVAACAVVTGGADRSVVGEAVWPTSRRRAWPLLRLGLDVLLALDADGLDDFFSAFFTLPERAWAGYAAAEATPQGVAAAMTRTFVALPPRLRRRVLARALSPAGARMLGRAALG
ncbi:lycopene cyclase family protein [Motilibacter aurantiacus]|uniref:lycopene cyclase family protein n=1 Tax=Motilibacter aurantiacus TaxID=2714955 RepID=UPI00140C0E9B|nr:FAD-binding protein [Motilibacter aurantiacus]